MKTVIVGGGPAGIMAAYSQTMLGDGEVILIEKNSRLLRKLMITGKGRCNITNDSDVEDMIKSLTRNPKFMYSAFYTFTNHDVVDLLEKNGLKTKVERGDRIFPVSDRAVDVVDAFVSILKSTKAKLITGHKVLEVVVDNVGHIDDENNKELGNKEELKKVVGIKLDNQKFIQCDKVILATGGMSYPKTGSDGYGFKIARSLGHNIISPRAALVGMISEQIARYRIKKMDLKNVSIDMYINGKRKYSDFGEMQLNNCGIDGPIIKSASCWINSMDDIIEIILDLKPALSEQKLNNRIIREVKLNPNLKVVDLMRKLLPSDLILPILDTVEVDREKSCSELKKEERENIVKSLKSYRIAVDGLKSIEEAIVTSGGVDVREINPHTMESKKVRGLFFAGEMIDVNAYTGGFNLQIAYSTGYLAGLSWFCHLPQHLRYKIKRNSGKREIKLISIQKNIYK